MTGEFVVAITAIGSAVIAAGATILSTILANRKGERRMAIAQLTDQIIAYWNLEKLYSTDMTAIDPKKRATKTILEDYRKAVQANGFARPKMTAHDANKIKESLHI